MTELAAQVFRDYNTDGVPASGAHQIVKSEVRTWGTDIEAATAPGPSFNFIGGLTLSNNGGTPNSILNIAAGACSDSTNASVMNLGAFTKSTAGAWASGSGNNGMGTGLTISNSTWYHVFAITNAGASDVYFDTSVTAANKPASTTAFRRIGSFKTDGSAHILAFTQTGDEFVWAAQFQEFNSTNPGTSAVTRTLGGVPLGAVSMARMQILDTNSGTGHWQLISALSSPDVTPSVNAFTFGSFGTGTGYGGTANVMVNTSAQIRTRQSASASGDILQGNVIGYRDFRGQ